MMLSRASLFPALTSVTTPLSAGLPVSRARSIASLRRGSEYISSPRARVSPLCDAVNRIGA